MYFCLFNIFTCTYCIMYLFQFEKLNLTWSVIYSTDGSHIFSTEPWSETGYWLGVWQCWFHLHGPTRVARSGNREIRYMSGKSPVLVRYNTPRKSLEQRLRRFSRVLHVHSRYPVRRDTTISRALWLTMPWWPHIGFRMAGGGISLHMLISFLLSLTFVPREGPGG